jgi:hypothetical protein
MTAAEHAITLAIFAPWALLLTIPIVRDHRRQQPPSPPAGTSLRRSWAGPTPVSWHGSRGSVESDRPSSKQVTR